MNVHISLVRTRKWLVVPVWKWSVVWSTGDGKKTDLEGWTFRFSSAFGELKKVTNRVDPTGDAWLMFLEHLREITRVLK